MNEHHFGGARGEIASCCNEKRGLRWYTRVRKVKHCAVIGWLTLTDRNYNCRHTLGVCDFVIMCTLTIMTRRRVVLFRKRTFSLLPLKGLYGRIYIYCNIE